MYLFNKIVGKRGKIVRPRAIQVVEKFEQEEEADVVALGSVVLASATSGRNCLTVTSARAASILTR